MERNVLFFWQRKSPDETREHGVGFYGQQYPAGIHRLICRWKRKNFLATAPLIGGFVISDQCPCPDSVIPQEKRRINYTTNWQSPSRESLRKSYQLIILDDFNARVGADQRSWPTCSGHFGIGKMSENSQGLLELCLHHRLCFRNAFFNNKPQHSLLETPKI